MVTACGKSGRFRGRRGITLEPRNFTTQVVGKFRARDPSQKPRYDIARHDVRRTADEGRVELPRVIFDRNGVVPLLAARARLPSSAAVGAWPERLHLPEHGTVDSVGGEALLFRQQFEALLIDECCVGGEREESRPLTVPNARGPAG